MTLYISALIGSFLFIAIRLKMEKQKADDDPKYRLKWKQYFSREWDDMLWSIFAGGVLTYMQEPIFYWFARWQELKDVDAIYLEGQNLIALLMGFLGSILITIAFKYAIRKANKLAE